MVVRFSSPSSPSVGGVAKGGVWGTCGGASRAGPPFREVRARSATASSGSGRPWKAKLTHRSTHIKCRRASVLTSHSAIGGDPLGKGQPLELDPLGKRGLGHSEYFDKLYSRQVDRDLRAHAMAHGVPVSATRIPNNAHVALMIG
jgi:hypothetical protein